MQHKKTRHQFQSGKPRREKPLSKRFYYFGHQSKSLQCSTNYNGHQSKSLHVAPTTMDQHQPALYQNKETLEEHQLNQDTQDEKNNYCQRPLMVQLFFGINKFLFNLQYNQSKLSKNKSQKSELLSQLNKELCYLCTFL